MKNRCQLFGISNGGILTIGIVEISINNETQIFHVVHDNFPTKHDGIIGMPFLKDSVIDLKEKVLTHDLGKFSILTVKKGITLNLKRRTKRLINLPIVNTELKTGYLPLMPSGPGRNIGP